MKKRYLSTCYIDRRNDLVGKLYISYDKSIYIDFGLKDIYCNNKGLSIQERPFEILEILIKSYNNIVLCDDIAYDIWPDSDFSEDKENNENQMISNAISYLKNQTDVGNILKGLITPKRNGGYAFQIGENIAIKRLNIEQEKIHDITDALSDIPKKNQIDYIVTKNQVNYKDIDDNNLTKSSKTSNNLNNRRHFAIEKTCLEFSSKFFHSRAKELMNDSIDNIDKEIENLSKVFNPICHLENDDVVLAFHNIVSNLNDKIVCSCFDDSIKNILKIKGPLGSYKTRILEFIFLKIVKTEDGILPFYINVSQYEKMAENNDKITENEIISSIKSDFITVKNIIENNSEKIPLLLLDGIRDFKIGYDFLYSNIAQCVKKLDVKLVVSMDSDFTMNRQRKFGIHPLAPNTFSFFLRINSMRLYNKEKSIEFIKNCAEAFKIPIKKASYESLDKRIENIYEQFVKMNLISLDAFWMSNLLKIMSANLYNPEYTISDLYHSLCMEFLGDEDLIDSAIELAYEYEYGSIDLRKTNFFFDTRWRLIIRHRSVLEYFIAKKYIKMLSNLDLRDENRAQTIKDLDFFNMVLQKTITRFVVTMINEIDDYEHNVLIIAEKYYNDLSLFGKSELTFWMGRLRNSKRKSRSIELLKEYRKIEQAEYEKNDFENIREKRDKAFILRGVTVSLIYENDKDSLCYYLNSLITDKIANSVNRGFHLEYYGDKPYIPKKSLLDFEDDLSKGENTLNVLCLSLDKRMEKNERNAYVALVELMTICNLIQARVEAYDPFSNVIWVGHYIKKCIEYLKWIRCYSLLDDMPKVKAYFEWMSDELLKLNYPQDYSKSNVFNLYTNSSKVKRTGWVESKIPNPENIVEHMYKCWLVGLLYLPDEFDDPEYDKQSILQMLLIHDLSETATGDINRPEKLKNLKHYDEEENKVMQSLMFSGTYPTSPNLNHYLDLWENWDNKSNINYKIAKDIDNIQTIYQYCDYHLAHPDLFSINDTVYWLSGVQELYSDIGKQIYATLITKNPLFKKLVSDYNNYVL